MAICKLTNRWNSDLTNAGMLVISPKGGSIFIRKLDCDLLTDDEWIVVESCVNATTSEIDLTLEQMRILHSAAVRSNGIVTPARTQLGTAATQGPSAPHSVSKAKPQKSFAQRKFERAKQAQGNYQKIVGGCCPSCNSSKLKVKRHAGWIGYYCGSCKGGGSLTLKK